MSKKNKNRPKEAGKNPERQIAGGPDAPLVTAPVVSKRGWKVIGIGIVVLAAGYGVLSLADPMGQNWASHVSPFLIIGGYVIVGVGIVSKDPVS